MVVAHAGHWLVNLIYMGPVFVIVGALVFQSYRDRHAQRRAEKQQHDKEQS